MWTLVRYLYRDAGNFKAFGCLALEGALPPEEQHALRSYVEGDALFIAEQLDVPPLYEELYRWSNGPTISDHCWHEFVDLTMIEDAEVPPDAYRWGSARRFLERVAGVDTWDEELSPHFRLEAWA